MMFARFTWLVAVAMPVTALAQPVSGERRADAVACYGKAMNARAYFENVLRAGPSPQAQAQMSRFESLARVTAGEVIHSATVAGNPEAGSRELSAAAQRQLAQTRTAAANGLLDQYHSELIEEANSCASRWIA